MIRDTPRALGYRMPAEWEPHAATWLSWPHNVDSWPGKFEPVPDIFAQIVAALHEHEAVHILAGSADLEDSARRALRARGCEAPNVRFFRIPTNDAWMRDHGPIFVVHPERGLALTKWKYNAWGGKYPPYDLDDQVPARINEDLRLPVFEPGIVLEGGSIDVQRSRDVADDRIVSLESESQSGARPARDRRTPARLSRRGERALARRRDSSATTPTGTSTTSADSSIRPPSSLPSRTIPPTRTTARCRRTTIGCER